MGPFCQCLTYLKIKITQTLLVCETKVTAAKHTSVWTWQPVYCSKFESEHTAVWFTSSSHGLYYIKIPHSSTTVSSHCTVPMIWYDNNYTQINRWVYLHSALFVVPHTQGAQTWITHGSYLQLDQCLPLPRKCTPDGASPDWGCGHLISAHYSFIYPERMKGW